jgi:hypothetical protein
MRELVGIFHAHRFAGIRYAAFSEAQDIAIVVTHHWWHEALHNQTNVQPRIALRDVPGVVLTSLPVRI